jgi:uncharacterized OsmC-like protein
MMGIRYGEAEGNLEDAYAEVTKHMAADPRRISRIEIDIYLPESISAKDRKILEHTARTCPVWYSLHEDISKEIRFFWTL